jgi:DNA-binding transcriptional LysR family regulator
MMPRKTLDLNTLRSFVTIAETGSMTRAAGRLHMTQSAISMQVKRLESSVDAALLERSRSGITPTPIGDQLLHYARQMLLLNDEAWGRLTGEAYEGRVSLGVPSDIINPVIPLVLRRFARDYPRVQVQLASALTNKLLKQFDAGKHDIVLTTELAAGAGGEVLSTQRLIWTGAINGSAWRIRPLPIGFSRACAFRHTVIRELDEAGIEWRDVVVAEDEIAGVATLSADLCVGAELEFAEHNGREVIDHGGRLPELPEHSVVMYRAENAPGSPGAMLGEYLAEAFAST